MTRYAAPITERQAARLDAAGLLADSPDELRDTWSAVEQMWAVTDERASTFPDAALHERVNGEWSYLETQRHLVFVTDAWLRDVILDRPREYDPVGIPPDFVTNGVDLGLDLDATPMIEQVVASRRRASGAVHSYLAEVTSEELDRRCTRFDGQFTVLGAVQNIVFQEWAHHIYAVRDLNTIEASGTGS